MAAAITLKGFFRATLAIFLAASVFTASSQNVDDSRDAKIAAAFRIFEEATVLGAKGDKASIQEAIAKLESIEPVFEKHDDKMKLAGTLTVHGGFLISVGTPEAALELMNRGLAIYKSIGYSPGQATTLLAIGSLYYKNNDLERARSSLEDARVQIEKQPLNSFDLPIYQALGNVYIALSERAKATEVLWKAYQIAKDRTPEEAINTLINYADAQIRLETPKYAVSFFEAALKRAQTANLRKLEVSEWILF